MSQIDKRLVLQIIGYLESLKQQLSEVDAESVDVATGMLVTSLGVDQSAEEFREFSYYPLELPAIFEAGLVSTNAQLYCTTVGAAEANPKFQQFEDMVKAKGFYDGTEEGSVEYMQRHAKLIQKFNERVNTTPAEKSSEEKERLAEDKKQLGNAAVSSKDYESAVQHYTEALDLSSDGPNSHIYFSNRAAAYCHLNEYAEAVADCEASIHLVPDYVKAISRLGLANFFLEKYVESVAAYEKAVELEPDNEGSKKSLKQARKKMDEQKRTSSSSSNAMSTGGGGGAGEPKLASMLNDPNFAGMLNSPMMKNAMDTVGGQDGLSNLMKDPQMMAMAQKMMQNPAALQQAMAMLRGGGAPGAEGGGMPDMAALAGMMGGLGGGAPGSSSSGSKSKSGKRAPFKGFEEDS